MPRPPRRRLPPGPGLLALAGALALGAGARAQEPERPARTYTDRVVAVVDGHPITMHELELACRLHERYHELPPGPSPARLALQREQLDALVGERTLLLKADELKVTLSEADEQRLRDELARAADAYRGVEGLRQALARIGVGYEAFAARKRTHLRIQKLLLTHVSREVFVTPEDIRRFYEQHKAEFERPAETRLRQLVLHPDPGRASRVPPDVEALVKAGAWDARAKAEELRGRIARGELAFEDAARAWSMGPNHDVEDVFPGDTPLADVLVPPLGERIDALAPGELSEVIESRRGSLHVVLLLDRTGRAALHLRDVQDLIEMRLKDAVWARRRDAWIAEVRDAARVERYLGEPVADAGEGGDEAPAPPPEAPPGAGGAPQR